MTDLIDKFFPNEKLITLGDFKIDPKTKQEVPLDTVLTHSVEFFSK